MPRVSRHNLPSKDVQQLSQHFSSLIASLKNEKQIEKFLEEFFTYEEKNMLAKRLALFMMLKQKYTSSSIQAMLYFSRETIRIYQQQFPLKSVDFHNTISHLLRMQKVKEFFESTGKFLYTVATSKTNMKSRAKLFSGNFK